MAWDPTQPVTDAALLSAPVRGNFAALDTAVMAPVIAAPAEAVLKVGAGDVVAPITAGSEGQALTLVSGAPAWQVSQRLCGGRLTYVNTTTLQFERATGAFIPVGDQLVTIPVTPITVTTSGGAASTIYYIYAYLSGGTLTLEKSTTGWARHTTWGHPIKSGDSTRTLVGLTATNSGTQFEDSPAVRGVASYWNRVPRTLYTASSSNWTSSATTDTILDAEMRVYFLAWTDETVQVSCFNTMNIDDAGGYATVSLGLDGGGGVGPGTFQAPTASALGSAPACTVFSGLGESPVHYIAMLVRVNAGTTVALFYSGVAGLAGTIIP